MRTMQDLWSLLKTRSLVGRDKIGNCRLIGALGASLLLVFIAFSPRAALAQLSPAPDGGYTGNNTAEGTDALFSLTTGLNNTAIGFEALFNNTTGASNTANGFQALFSNTT